MKLPFSERRKVAARGKEGGGGICRKYSVFLGFSRENILERTEKSGNKVGERGKIDMATTIKQCQCVTFVCLVCARVHVPMSILDLYLRKAKVA